MSESTAIQRLIDDATVANKPSRLQAFELNPTRGEGTIFIDKNQRRWALKALFLVVLLAALAVTAGAGLAQDLAEYALLLPLASAGFQYGDTDFIRSGDIEINVQIYSSGGADGSVAATWIDEYFVAHEVTVDFTGLEAVRGDRNGDLELVLNGRGKYVTDGKEQAFAATAVLNWNAWTADDLRLSLLGETVLPADLRTGPLEGRVEGSYPYDVFCDQYGENCQPAPP